MEFSNNLYSIISLTYALSTHLRPLYLLLGEELCVPDKKEKWIANYWIELDEKLLGDIMSDQRL